MDILEEDILEGGEYSHEDVLDGCQGGYSAVYTGTSRTANNFHWKKPCEGFLVNDSLVSVLVCEYGNKLLHQSFPPPPALSPLPALIAVSQAMMAAKFLHHNNC